jgi:hypothetical protein
MSRDSSWLGPPHPPIANALVQIGEYESFYQSNLTFDMRFIGTQIGTIYEIVSIILGAKSGANCRRFGIRTH